MKEHQRILELAAEARLPDTIDGTYDLPIDIVRELIDAGYLKALDASSFSGEAYLEPKITLAGREYLGQLRRQNKMQEDRSGVRLFISHSSRDSALVELMVALLRAALNLPASAIRCTSIDGYRIPIGADTDEQLRREVHAADAFIGIISPESLKSLYVVFELGARWGARRPLFPVLAPGTDTKILSGPLIGLNALSAGNRSQLHQLVNDLAEGLEIKAESPAGYDRHIDAILSLKAQHSPESGVSSGSERRENDKWEERAKNYRLTETQGGAVVYQSCFEPRHFVCPSCFEKKQISILQDRRVVGGVFDCPACKAVYRIKPLKI
jgi:hypothetical protein